MNAIALVLVSSLAGTPAPTHFERHHPDVYFRGQGLAALDEGRTPQAVEALRKAALHADKGSQALLAEMYWDGRDVERQRALAYVWMDMAAERGYPLLVAKREQYWAALTAAERDEALRIGPGVFAEYADEVAKPRLEKVMRKGLRDSPGSRVGGASPFVEVYTDVRRSSLGNGVEGVRHAQYYAANAWSPHHYWAQTDLLWSRPPSGFVEVAPLQTEAKRTGHDGR